MTDTTTEPTSWFARWFDDLSRETVMTLLWTLMDRNELKAIQEAEVQADEFRCDCCEEKGLMTECVEHEDGVYHPECVNE